DVPCRRLDRLRLARRWPVPQAVARGAEVRAALHDPPRDVLAGPTRLVAPVGGRDAGIRDRSAAGVTGPLVVPGGIEVGRPLPDVAGHVVEAIAVRRERRDRRRPLEAIFERVLPGELALPGVRHHPATRRELVPPK